MDSSLSLKDEIWFLRVCHHISNAVYICQHESANLIPHYVPFVQGKWRHIWSREVHVSLLVGKQLSVWGHPHNFASPSSIRLQPFRRTLHSSALSLSLSLTSQSSGWIKLSTIYTTHINNTSQTGNLGIRQVYCWENGCCHVFYPFNPLQLVQ
jgi:hypothetical protein